MEISFLVLMVIITALVFDFTNGFHDTANAMATSIATGALRPKVAVSISAVLNLIGAFLSVEVARTISGGIVDEGRISPAIIFGGLVGAIVWNLITWYFGLPSSSSHALFGGLIVATDLRLLGIALKTRPAAEVVNSLRPLKHGGLTLMVLCGLLMFGTKAEEYLLNPWFHAKLTLLVLVGVHALVFRSSVYEKVAQFDAEGTVPGVAKFAAVLSLILWTGLIICGRGIGYINPDLDRIHALLR